MDNEKTIVNQAKTDINAFGKLYEYYFQKVYMYVYSKCKNKDISEDVVSITFSKALKNIPKYEDRGYSFGTWLYTIARNELYDNWNESKKMTQIPDFPVNNSEGDVTATGAERETMMENVMNVVKFDLPAHYQEIIELRYVSGFSLAETAEITGKSIDSIKSITKRAFATIRKNIEL